MESYEQFYKYAKKLALKWRHTKQMIIDKLLNKGATISFVEQIVMSLSNEGIIDDEKVFQLDIFAMEEKRYSYKRVKEYLIKKNFDRRLIESYVFNIGIEEDNCRYHFIKVIKKYKNYKYIDDEREKIRNYLKRCGFNDRIINEVIRAGISYENVMWL